MEFSLRGWSPQSRTTAFVLFAFLTLGYAQQPAQVKLDDGSYSGLTANGVNKFLGVRYAAPPQRFSPPVASSMAPHNDVMNATAFAPSCIQAIPAAIAATMPSGPESEDCLFLNVYAPSSPPPAEGRTIMVWYYGGGFQFGSANTPMFDGSSFAQNQDVIIVTPNYRTSVFGFPGDVEDIPPQMRNVGLMDQKLALQWVQRNIKAFGGDPNKVTLFGESAGASSVDLLLLTSGAQPPFRAVITESGTSYLVTGPQAGGDIIGLMTGLLGRPNMATPFQTLAASLKCGNQKSLDCVKAAPVEAIVSVLSTGPINFPPVADGDANGGRYLHNGPATDRFGGLCAATFLGDTALQKAVVTAYPVGAGMPFPTPKDAITQFATGLDWTCSIAHEARLSAQSGVPTWRYLFNSTSFPPTPGGILSRPVHGSEIGFVFGNLPPPPATPDQALALSKFMQTAWANFAKNPTNGPGVPAWTQFSGMPGSMDLGNLGGVLGDGVSMIDSKVVDSRCNLFDASYAKTK
ncbi:Alpha/Beta hydrolase protein [Colletotrichum phormii]|uniref:Carboxylic ester hydrolase n=1 Tax=Colletotrichum phormii TaxID=359342 RepID=A0AAJ0A1L1_9PEZI|nr:Alpha/Beta hydrolase protein [Colletotrichum phormii]KAK1640442.1 Alpha/Beta hydrolase protein [Colletotrichum phormii]